MLPRGMSTALLSFAWSGLWAALCNIVQGSRLAAMCC